MLESLGLSAVELTVYRRVVEGGPCSLRDVAGATGLTRWRCERAAARLLEVGLVERVAESKGARYVARHPAAPLSQLVREQEMELAAAKTAVGRLADEFHAKALRSGTEGMVEIIAGPDEVRGQVRSLESAAEREICVLDRPPYSFPDPDVELARERPLLERGVAFRVIYVSEALAEAGRWEVAQMLSRLGEQARVLPELPTKLITFDGRAALVPLAGTAEATDAVLLVHPSGMLDALQALFEELWARAVPLPSSPSEAPGGGGVAAEDEVDRVALLLAAGLTDQAIARQLDLSNRTMRRRVASLYDRASARTRYQAGFVAGLAQRPDPGGGRRPST